MAKFGNLIDSDFPILFGFHKHADRDAIDPILEEVLQELEGKIKVYKIEGSENPELINALEIKNFPSYVIFNKGEMVWRENTGTTAEKLLNALQPYL